MKRNLPILVFFAFIACFFTQCKKEDRDPDNKAEENPIELLEAAVFEDGGVQLVAQINKVPDNIEKYGFVISIDSLIGPYNGQFYYIDDKPLEKGILRKDFHSRLEKNRKYYYSFFTINDSTNLKVYPSRSFISNGSKQVKIDSISTNLAHLADSIYIYGKYFSKRYISVSFGSVVASANVLNDSVLMTYVPGDLMEVAPVVKVNYDTSTKVVSNTFSLYKPVIKKFTNDVSINGTVTIEGEHFDLDTNRMSIYFDQVRATILSADRNQIKVRVPEDLEKVKSSLVINAQKQRITSDATFNLLMPTLDAVPSSGKAWQEIILKGKHFHPQLHKNKVFFEGVEADLLNGDTSFLRVKVPMGPFPRRAAKVKLKLLDGEVSYKTDFKLNDVWVMVSRNFPGDRESLDVRSIEGNVFASTFGNSYGDHKMYLHKWNSSNYTWTTVTNTSVPGSVVALNDKLYYCRSAGGESQLKEYDYKTNTWTELPEPPKFEERYLTTAFAAGNYIYLLFSQPWGQTELTFPMHRYNRLTKKWEEVAGMPSDLYGASEWNRAFSISNGKIALVGAGATISNSGNLQVYNIASNQWTATPVGGPTFLAGATGFTYNDQIYIIPSSSSNYDFNSRSIYRYEGNRWTKLKDLIGPDDGVFHGDDSKAFVVGNKAYVLVWNQGIVGIFEALLADLK